MAGLSVAALGIAAAFVAAFTIALSFIDPGQAGVGSGIINTFHELGGAIGVAVVSSIAAPSLATTSLSPAGFTHAFTFSAAAALAASAVATLVVPAGKAPSSGAMPHPH